jgi:hypothetical protein
MIRRFGAAALVALVLVGAAAPTRAGTCASGRSSTAAMWLSILHAGLGEWHLKGWHSFSRVPQKKFWLGFIPVFGWPYLSVVSAIDVAHCRIDDGLELDP